MVGCTPPATARYVGTRWPTARPGGRTPPRIPSPWSSRRRTAPSTSGPPCSTSARRRRRTSGRCAPRTGRRSGQQDLPEPPGRNRCRHRVAGVGHLDADLQPGPVEHPDRSASADRSPVLTEKHFDDNMYNWTGGAAFGGGKVVVDQGGSAGEPEPRRLRVFGVAGVRPTVETDVLEMGRVGKPYSQQLEAADGVGALQWSVTGGALPAGVTMSASGKLSGTPTVAGQSQVTIRATDSSTVAATRCRSRCSCVPASVVDRPGSMSGRTRPATRSRRARERSTSRRRASSGSAGRRHRAAARRTIRRTSSPDTDWFEVLHDREATAS